MALSDLAFKTTFKPYRQLVILGQTIQSSLIKSISPLNAELDYPHLTQFNIGNVSITLFDPDGDFNPHSASNFWTTNWNRPNVPVHYNQVGYKGSVEIHIGYDRDGTIDSEKIFDGEVSNIRVNLQPPEVVIEAVDSSQKLRSTKVFDFGIRRTVTLPEDRTHNQREHGRYVFPDASIPSEQSVSAITTPTALPMTNVDTIATDGLTDPLNYQVTDTTLETEGSPLPGTNLPVATYRDVYRYKRVSTLLKQLLAYYGISDYDVNPLPQETDTPNFSSLGRPGWDFESNTAEGIWDWDGYVKDVVYDSTANRFYMLYGQRSNQVADKLIAYDVGDDRWITYISTDVVVRGQTLQYEMWQLATDDFDEFYVLATVFDESSDGTLIFGVYDAWEPQADILSQIRILKFVRSTNTWSIVDDVAGNAPQIGFYYSAFQIPEPRGVRYPMLPDTRSSFTIATLSGDKKLVYRGKDGIHTYQLDDGTKGTLKTIPAASRRSMDFWIGDTDATTFFAWIVRGANTTHIRIDDGSGTQILNLAGTTAVGSNEINTISDMIYHNDDLYFVLQVNSVQKPGIRQDSVGYLVKVDVSAGTLRRLQFYDQFPRAARSPVLHEGEIYYFEGSHYQYQPHAAVTDREGELVEESEAYPNRTGNLIKIVGNEVVELGLWRSAAPKALTVGGEVDIGYGRHGGTASPLISDGDNIHLWTGYGDLTKLNTKLPDGDEHPVNSVDNWQWLQHGKALPQRIPVFRTNGKKAWDLMNELARLTNATISYQNGRFSFLPRATRETTLRLDLTDTATSHAAVVDAERFPTSGMVLINDELISYTTKSADNSDIELLTRGEEQSQATTHQTGDTVLFVDALVFNHPDKKNLGSLRFKPDFLGIYNQLTGKLTPVATDKAEVYVENVASVEANDGRARDFDFSLLTSHEKPWARVLLNEYLIEMQQTQFEVSLELPWAPHLKLGQTLVVDQQVVAHLRFTPVRILQISHDFESRMTRITGRTFGLHRTSQTSLQFDGQPQSEYVFIVNEPITTFTLPEAVGGLGMLTYSLSSLPSGLNFNSSSREVSGTPSATGTTLMTYTVTDSSTVPQEKQITFRIVVVNALAFDSNVPSKLVFGENCYIDYELPATSGGIEPVGYTVGGLPTEITFNPITRRLRGFLAAGESDIEYLAVDAETNSVSQAFDLVGDTTPNWTALFVRDTEYAAIDDTSNTLRYFNPNGQRVPVIIGNSQTMNLDLGTGDWRGATVTTDRKIYLANDGTVKFYGLDNVEQTAEQLALGAGDWQDVAVIDGKLGFLDRATYAIRMYSLARTRLAGDDIAFGLRAEYRSITANADGSKIFVLVENLPTLLVWQNDAFDVDAAINIIEGTSGWQVVTMHPAGHLLLIHEMSTRAIAMTLAGNRDENLDLRLRGYGS